MAYEILALLDDQATITLEELGERLRQRFSKDGNALVRIEVEKPDVRFLVVRWGKWAFRLAMSSGPHVAEESAALAAEYARERPDRFAIAACQRRIELTGDRDPNMDHFNDHLCIAEVLLEIPGTHVFSDAEGRFWEEHEQ